MADQDVSMLIFEVTGGAAFKVDLYMVEPSIIRCDSSMGDVGVVKTRRKSPYGVRRIRGQQPYSGDGHTHKTRSFGSI